MWDYGSKIHDNQQLSKITLGQLCQLIETCGGALTLWLRASAALPEGWILVQRTTLVPSQPPVTLSPKHPVPSGLNLYQHVNVHTQKHKYIYTLTVLK